MWRASRRRLLLAALAAGAAALAAGAAALRAGRPAEPLNEPLPAGGLPPEAARRPGTVVWVAKDARRLCLCRDGRVERRFRAALGANPADDKRREGDGCTPEGEFYVCRRNPRSRFGLALLLSYPNEEDAARGLAAGLVSREQHEAIVAAVRARRTPPQDTPLGSLIEIHGGGSGRDWTVGCVALDDADMRLIYEAAPPGTPVVITK